VILPFSQVSKVHAYLSKGILGGWTIEDSGSRNGTIVDGVKLVAGRAVAVPDGATVVFGGLAATFWLPASFRDRYLRTSPGH
jgi:pSer/pThr/pTyr-binding forkhead associated (FHA) protein